MMNILVGFQNKSLFPLSNIPLSNKCNISNMHFSTSEFLNLINHKMYGFELPEFPGQHANQSHQPGDSSRCCIMEHHPAFSHHCQKNVLFWHHHYLEIQHQHHVTARKQRRVSLMKLNPSPTSDDHSKKHTTCTSLSHGFRTTRYIYAQDKNLGVWQPEYIYNGCSIPWSCNCHLQPSQLTKRFS